ncbi:TPA: RtcB family protein [Streptococcus pyogenes]|nr:RtcB family protein [Streptococcus pyogenes]
MKIIEGSNTTAKVFTNLIDDVTSNQIELMLNEAITEGATVRIMPDTHFGKGATIGTTIKLPDDRAEWKIAPQVVGVDLSCGMMSVKITEKDIDLKKLDEVVHQVVPAGNRLHAIPQRNIDDLISSLSFAPEKAEQHKKGLGTLGGGNHFIELSVDEEGNYWLTVHSGSRSFGAEIARHHERIAKKYHSDHSKEIKEIISSLKELGREKDIESEIMSFKNSQNFPEIPYLEGELLQDYLNDIRLADQYAALSRQVMLHNIATEMGWESSFLFDSVHNNIDDVNGIIRKGATSAQEGELLIIPLNMRDGSLICVGKGNADWNFSAPHGAGRLLSRKAARKSIKLEDYQKQMKDVYTSSVGLQTLDEAPGAYKPAQLIISSIWPTVEIKHHLKPVYNFKAH